MTNDKQKDTDPTTLAGGGGGVYWAKENSHDCEYWQVSCGR